MRFKLKSMVIGDEGLLTNQKAFFVFIFCV